MQTLFDKVWLAHTVSELDGGGTLVYIDRILLHERTGSVALLSLKESDRTVRRPASCFGVMDHIVDTLPGRGDKTLMPSGTDFITAMREGCKWADIPLFDVTDKNQGIVHVISPEQGIVLPGLSLVCPDSHTCTQGAFGALAWGIGSTEAEHALATNCLRINRPKTMRITLSGGMPSSVTAKDISLALIAEIGAAGGSGHVIEFAGDTVSTMDMEARMTLCNMAAELSAFTALIAPDEKTYAYLKGRRFSPNGAAWDTTKQYWATLYSDTDAVFDKEISLNTAALHPMVTWGTSPEHAVSLDGAVPDREEKAREYMQLEPGTKLDTLPVNAAFIGSCTNSRISDLRRAAKILKGQHVAIGVRAICVPGSQAVKRQAETEGLDRIFLDAGFEWREPGCSMCFYAGGESFGAQDRVISTTNRNFENRQGPGTRTHIASPETVAASAIKGMITAANTIVNHGGG